MWTISDTPVLFMHKLIRCSDRNRTQSLKLNDPACGLGRDLSNWYMHKVLILIWFISSMTFLASELLRFFHVLIQMSVPLENCPWTSQESLTHPGCPFVFLNKCFWGLSYQWNTPLLSIETARYSSLNHHTSSGVWCIIAAQWIFVEWIMNKLCLSDIWTRCGVTELPCKGKLFMSPPHPAIADG